MKKIKNYALGLLSAGLLTLGLYACTNEDANGAQNEVPGLTPQTKSTNNFKEGAIAVIRNGIAVPLYNEADLKTELVTSGAYTDVESVELAYGLNPDTSQYEAFVTVIGTEAATAKVVGIVADLRIDGDKLIILNPETNQQAYASNSCDGTNCGWCQFDRSWFLGRIKGCKPCSRINDENKPASCDHKTTDSGLIALLSSVFSLFSAGL